MIKPLIPENEEQRLEELYRFEILDTAYEREFDEIVELASQICGVPISLISLIEKNRQWLKARVGLSVSETSREVSFCAHAIASDSDLFEVEDATQDERFHDNPLVTSDPNIRFYAGIPLVSNNGFKLGTLCVIDSKPHVLTKEQVFALKSLAHHVIRLMELRMRNDQLNRQQKLMQQQAEMQKKIISIIAHDVRNPVSSLKNIIELGQNNILSEDETKELMIMAEKQLDGTINLLSELVEWGKMHAAAASTGGILEKVHLKSLVTDKLKEFEVAASLKGNTLLNQVEKNVVFNTDVNIFCFILRNLVSNANKFTSNGTISIHAHRAGKRVLVSVSDTGVGMDSNVQGKLFDVTKKHIALGTNKEKGSGLGLILTKDFVEMLDGKLNVESEPGKGTTIHLDFKS